MTKHQIIAVVALTAIFCFEQYFPNRKRVPYWWKHFRRNCLIGSINGLFTSVTGAAVSVGVISWLGDHSVGLLRMGQGPEWIEFAIAFILFDLWIYTWHWTNHQIPFLWRFHRVHHSDPAMDMTTALRFHPVEIMLSSVLNIIIFAIIGLNMEVLIIYKGIFHMNVLFHHSNFRISPKMDRFMRTLIVSPNMHRIHHSNIREETDSNYSSLFSFWDRIFGTYRRRDVKEITFGLEKWMEEKWQTVAGLLKLPFQENRE